jgi:hypothetical protein
LKKSWHNISIEDFDKCSYLEKEFEMKKVIWTIVFILFVAATLCACSSDEFPTGTYTFGNHYTVEYRDDGTMTLWSGDEIVTEGTYSVTDDEVTITDSYCNEKNAGSATYKWHHEDGVLTWELIGDDFCKERLEDYEWNWFGPK